jgi:DNA polymerase (family 10)
MMTNDEITDALEITAKLMELHNENPFKAKAYANAAFRLSKLRYDFNGKTKEDIESIEGIGKSISSKIIDLATTGTTADLREMVDKTPAGVIDMLGIKGLGPKKVRQLWLDLQVESTGELLYACNENRLLTLKGFGEKTQAQVKQNIEFRIANSHKFHYAALEKPVLALVEALRKAGLQAIVTGQMARKCEIIDKIEILICGNLPETKQLEQLIPLPVNYITCDESEFYLRSIEHSSAPAHLTASNFSSLEKKHYASEEDVYDALGLQFVPPELREGLTEVELAKKRMIPALIETADLRGILHNHTTYSDGVHTLKEMADYCKSLGYEYLGICDHSKTAVYANGLSIERVAEQHKEIEQLNAGYSDFKILKGIESDILGDGSLDYPEEILKTFDFVVASVHSGLKMNEEKATERLIKAIENPYTTILGHPTGRLLLAREGYPIHHRKIIDACAANKVTIELNAHPYRLDIDWRWIPYCLEKGVMISINPDAHHKEGFHDMYYGVCAARKGMLTAAACLNALHLPDLLDKFKK